MSSAPAWLLFMFFIATSTAETSKISKVAVKARANKFRCSFSLAHHSLTLDTQESSILCSPKTNKADTVKALRISDAAGCTFVLSFRIKKGKGLGLSGTVDCPTISTPALMNTTTVGPTTVGPTTAAPTTVAPTTVGPTTAAPTTVGPSTTYSREPPVGEVKALPCGCSCDCPEDGGDCDCLCDCPAPLVTAPPTCAPGFTKICPQTSGLCPPGMQELCPPQPGQQEGEQAMEEEVSDRILTAVTKTVKISGKSFKCAISISHGCVTTLTTNIKCSPGKPKLKGSIRFGKDGYTFEVDFQTPSKVLKASLVGVPCPKCPCKSPMCSPPCPTSTSNTTTASPTTSSEEVSEAGTEGSESGSTTTAAGSTSSAPGPGPGQREYSDEGCSCVPNFMLFFSQQFFMQKSYEDNGFLSTCYCLQEGHYQVQASVK